MNNYLKTLALAFTITSFAFSANTNNRFYGHGYVANNPPSFEGLTLNTQNRVNTQPADYQPLYIMPTPTQYTRQNVFFTVEPVTLSGTKYHPLSANSSIHNTVSHISSADLIRMAELTLQNPVIYNNSSIEQIEFKGREGSISSAMDFCLSLEMEHESNNHLLEQFFVAFNNIGMRSVETLSRYLEQEFNVHAQYNQEKGLTISQRISNLLLDIIRLMRERNRTLNPENKYRLATIFDLLREVVKLSNHNTFIRR